MHVSENKTHQNDIYEVKIRVTSLNCDLSRFWSLVKLEKMFRSNDLKYVSK